MKNKFYSINTVELSEDGLTSEVEVLRVGVIQDRGLKITEEMLRDFVAHYEDNSYGTELQVNLNHERGSAAAGWIKRLYLDTTGKVARLMSSVEWTVLGVENIKNKLYKFVSAEFVGQFSHHETGKMVKNVFSGLALTNTPALKGQTPISLSEDIKIEPFKQEDNTMFKKYITNLSERAFVTKEDKTFAKAEFTALSEEEQAENKPAMDAVEAKPEAPAEEKPVEAPVEKPKEGEPAEAQLKEKLDSATSTLAEANKRIEELEARNTKVELNAQFEKSYMLTEQRTVGFAKNVQDDVVSLLSEMSTDQRERFSKIFDSIRSVNLEVLGGKGKDMSGDLQDQIVALTDKIMAEDKTMTVEKAQKKAVEQLKVK